MVFLCLQKPVNAMDTSRYKSNRGRISLANPVMVKINFNIEVDYE